MKQSFFIFICVFSVVFAIEKVKYDNYKVLKVNIKNENQLDLLKKIENFDTSYNFIDSPQATNTDINLVVPPHKIDDIYQILTQNKFTFDKLTDNLQETFDNERVAGLDDDFGWTAYYPLESIYKWLSQTALANAKVVTPFEIGKSYEGRPILGIKISYKEGNPGIFMETNIHAREWITSATVTWIINELLTSNNTNVRDLAENIDWYIIPVLNVDGFEYSHETNRLWRKTRQPSSSLCFGTDGNRNFDYLWFTGGSSNNPCSDTYAGPSAFSEPEIKALASFYDKVQENITAYLAIHSYGQYLLYPYGAPNAENVNNEDEHIIVANATVTKLAERYGTVYTYGRSSTHLYDSSGISIDWAKGVYNTPFAYTYEFRDKGKFGFVLPADQIIPNAEEVLDSLLAFVESARQLGYFKK